MKFFSTILLFLVVSSIFVCAGSKKEDPQKVVPAQKLQNINIVLDGKLSEPVWQSKPVNEFTQKDPDEGKPSTEETDVWIAYDNENIYVAARLYDSKADSIDASLSRRDNFIDSDWFVFYVDPYNDKKTGYFFGINAGGTIADGVLFNDSWDDWSWDGIWESKTSIDAKGWTVEMKIPFSQMRFNQAEAMTWGVNFHREIKRNNEKSYLVMVPKKESGFVSRFASLEGLNGVNPKQRFEVMPYMVQKAQYLVHDSNDPFYKSNQYKTTIGADFKIGIGSNLNVDATINPDFGQVEVDPAVINLSAFESYFDEKRPFFIEGMDKFYFGIGGSNSNWGFNFGWPELFYSRRIGRSPRRETSDADYTNYPSETRILGAAKLTGKLSESVTVGTVSAVTERTYATLWNEGKRTEEEVEPLTYYNVLRAKKEFNDGRQSLGVMFTSVNRIFNDNSLSEDLSQNAYALGLDGWTFLDEDKEYVLTGAFSGTYVSGTKEYLQNLQESPLRYYQRPDASYVDFDSSRTSLSGYYGRLMLNKQQGNFYINSAVGLISPGFEQNDLGYQWMADRINMHTAVGYRWFDPEGIFRSKETYVAYARSFDFEGNSISNFFWGRIAGTFTNYYYLNIGGNLQFETVNKTATRGGPLMINPASFYSWIYANSDSREKIYISGEVDYSKDKEGSDYKWISIGLTWKPNSQITFKFGPEYTISYEKNQWVDNIDDATAVNTYKTRYVFAEIKQHTLSTNIRLNWTFTPTLSLQLFLQPFFAVGDYSGFKELAKPGVNEFNKFGENGSTINYDGENEEYNVDPDGSGPAEKFTFDQPDFNYKSLRGTAVLRWETMPGSILYFVWSHNQANYDDPGRFSFGRDFRSLWNTQGDNVFLVKFSYWLDI
jgi:hypothetical protein